MTDQPGASIQYAITADASVVVRVVGRGNHVNAIDLRRVFEETQDGASRYIIDLQLCDMMDSTFMGTIAGIALSRRKSKAEGVVVTNIAPHVRRLLDTLGLKYLIEMRPDPGAGGATFTTPDPTKLSKRERLLMMIEAHERLCDMDNENELKFKGVLDNLYDSLEREGGADQTAQ